MLVASRGLPSGQFVEASASGGTENIKPDVLKEKSMKSNKRNKVKTQAGVGMTPQRLQQIVGEGILPHLDEIEAAWRSGGFAIFMYEPSEALAAKLRDWFVGWDFVQHPVIGADHQCVLLALGEEDTVVNWVHRKRGKFDLPILVFTGDGYLLLNSTRDGYQAEPEPEPEPEPEAFSVN